VLPRRPHFRLKTRNNDLDFNEPIAGFAARHGVQGLAAEDDIPVTLVAAV
jgi:hypothetical protein